MKLSDEILNKYIDNELSEEEKNKIKKMLLEDDELMKNLKALQMLEDSMQKLKLYKSSSDFTSKVMNRIQKVKMNYQSDTFFIGTISFLILFLVGIIGYIVTSFFSLNFGNSQLELPLRKISFFIVDYFGLLSKIFNNPFTQNILLSVILLILLNIILTLVNKIIIIKKSV